MNNISEFLSLGHRHCDDLFVDAENAMIDSDFGKAEAKYPAFQEEMETHFNLEENVMFLAFESATGMSEGPTEMMRIEHMQMRELLGQMKNALTNRHSEDFLGLSETLLILMQQHNFKEENMLYRMADEVIGQDGAVIVERMKVLQGVHLHV